MLAVTGAMFVLAILAINGKQNQTEFQQSINDIQSEIQQSIDQVAAGDYPNTNNFTCNATGGTLNISGGTNNQGSNTGCIFLGKVLQFGESPTTNPEHYIAYTIAGLQNNNGGSLATANANPWAIAPGTPGHPWSSFPDASVTNALHGGLTTHSMDYVDSTGTHPIGAVAFISSLGQYSGGSLVSGSQQIDLYPVDGSALGDSSPTTVDKIDSNLASSPPDPSGGVHICFASGGTNQSGLITIGSNGRNLSVTLQIKNGGVC